MLNSSDNKCYKAQYGMIQSRKSSRRRWGLKSCEYVCRNGHGWGMTGRRALGGNNQLLSKKQGQCALQKQKAGAVGQAKLCTESEGLGGLPWWVVSISGWDKCIFLVSQSHNFLRGTNKPIFFHLMLLSFPLSIHHGSRATGTCQYSLALR